MVNEKANNFREKGNEWGKPGFLYDSLVLYNKSLCHAVSGSESMALAYANRAAVYIEVNQYEKCLESIAAALKNKYPEEKLAKLMGRKERCEKKMKSRGIKKDTFEKYEFKLTRPANPKLPCLADCLELRNNEKYGNHIVTAKTLYPGDIIAVEDFFYYDLIDYDTLSMIVGRDKDVYYQFCAYCLNSNYSSLQPCEDCETTMYCSEECRVNAQPYHAFECDVRNGLITTCYSIQPLCVRSFFKALAICNNDINELKSLVDSQANGAPLTAFDLDYTAMSEEEIKRKSILVAYGGTYSTRTESDFKAIGGELRTGRKTLAMMKTHGKFIMQFIRRMDQVHTHNLYYFAKSTAEKGSKQLLPGCFQSIALSLFSHSCAPNVFRVETEKMGYALIVNQVIKPGEQIFDNRSVHHAFVPKAVRQDVLRNFGLKCDCDACKFDYPMLKDLKKTSLPPAIGFEMYKIVSLNRARKLHEHVKVYIDACFDYLKNACNEEKEHMCDDIILVRNAVYQLLQYVTDTRFKIHNERFDASENELPVGMMCCIQSSKSVNALIKSLESLKKV